MISDGENVDAASRRVKTEGLSLTGSRFYVSRILLWLAILVFFLLAQAVLLEGILRVVGYGESTRFLVRREVNGTTVYTPNRAFYQQFSALPLDRIMTWDDLDFQVPEAKAPNAYRIFVFGGSAIYGTRTSARILEMMLRERAPSVRWEVYNAACPGMNSHVMLRAARACAALEPDLFLVYMGNNEAVGPFGPATTLGQSRLFWRIPVIRALIAANELRVVQLLRRVGAARSVNLPDTDALMRMLPGMTDHPRTLVFYERNVRDVCVEAARANATALLCTLSGNRRFMGVDAPEPADDAGQSINGVLRRQATLHDNTLLADVAGALAARSEDGLPGYDFFVDNVHFNFDGNYLAASAMFEALAPLLQLDAAPPEKEACAAALAWTSAAEFDLLGWQLQAFLDDHSRERVRRRYEELRQAVGENWRARLLNDHIAALQRYPDDLYLRQTAFRLAFDLGDAVIATEQSRELCARHPAARAALRSAGMTAELRGDADAAINKYHACLNVYPDDPEALRRLAELLFNRGNKDAAEPLYKRYLRIDGTDAFVWCRIGEIQAYCGQARRAAATWRRVIEQAPTHPYAYRLLDELLAETQSEAERAAYWDDMIARHPEAAEPLVRRALLHEAAGEQAEALALLRRAVALSPGDPVAQERFDRAVSAAERNSDRELE